MWLIPSGLFFIFGTLIGSFLNVVVLRYNTGKGLGGRSSCQSCGRQLAWFELLPILSFVALSGKCKVCSSTISLQYPLVEGVTGLLFLGLFLKGVVGVELVIVAVIGALLISIAVYDARHGIIPDGLVYAFGVFALAYVFLLSHNPAYIPSALSLLSGVIIAFPLFVLWFISNGRWIGFGDVKLSLGMGWLLGISGGISALMFSFWIGALVGVALLALPRVIGKRKLKIHHKDLTMKSELPFAPFMIVGIFLVYFFELNIISYLFP